MDQINRTRGDFSLPKISYQHDLPIIKALPEIEQQLKTKQVLIVAGETGSGKTTQLPLACLKTGFGLKGMIGHTQPRRLAARSVADRVADQLNIPLGREVGYAVRFEDRVSPNTIVKVLTDGLLLNEIRSDRALNAYEVIILDEAHERSLNIDFLLGYLKKVLKRRPKFRVIVTSATIDVDSLSAFFGNAPVIKVEGRSYPVEVRYRPPEENVESCVEWCMEEIEAEPPSSVQDLLVFLPGEREILKWAQWFRRKYGTRYEVLPLYARLPTKEQRKIFSSSSRRRILLSTNVAETSLTVPNIRYVIDFGDARISRYSPHSRIQRLPIERISQASAQQRAGRCGRLAPGICYRLYDEKDFVGRDRYTPPEIRRTNLAAVILQMKVFRYGAVEKFPFLDPPNERMIQSAYRVLHELGALEHNHITELGRKMVLFPVDPRLARMIIQADKQRALAEVLVIVSALAVQSPLLRPVDHKQTADQAHRQFRDSKSDFLTFVRLWEWAEELRHRVTRRMFRTSLEKLFISPQRYGEWRALHRQLLLTCHRVGMRLNRNEAAFEDIHKSILAGSLGFIGVHTDTDSYQGARNLKFRLFPGSVLAKRKPKWVVASEIVETSNTFARCLSEIKPQWIEPFAQSVVKRRVHSPYWDERRNEAMALLDVTLYGLPLIQGRRVRLAEHDLHEAGRLFLLHGVVSTDGVIAIKEVKANRELVISTRETQAKIRRMGLVASDEKLVDFYRDRVPETVVNQKSFRIWYKETGKGKRAQLRMTESDILLKEPVYLRRGAFPAELDFGGRTFPLQYKFAPGHADDGVSLRVPLSELYRVVERELEWSIPGYFEELCESLLRGLPKGTRKQLNPIADHVEELVPTILDHEDYRSSAFNSTLSSRIRALFGVEISPDAWDYSKLPLHLKLNIQVVDGNGTVISQSRDLVSLKEEVNHLIDSKLDDNFMKEYELEELTEYPKQGILERVEVTSTAGPVTLFPVLVDEESSVALRMQIDEVNQERTTIRGLSRLILLLERQSVKYLRSQFQKDKVLRLQQLSEGSQNNLREAILLTAARRTFLQSTSIPRSVSEFNHLIHDRRNHFVPSAIDLINLVSDLLKVRQQIALSIEQLNSPSLAESRKDIEHLLQQLFPTDFPYSCNDARLRDFPRYLDALQHRVAQITGRALKDLNATKKIGYWQHRWESLDRTRTDSVVLEELFHLLQEYRIALFCPTMKTRVKVSSKRLDRAFSAVIRGGESASQ